MIMVLRFEESRSTAVRTPSFAMRSTLPLQAACLVANGVCEQMKHLLGRDLELDLIAPIVPDRAAFHVLFKDAIVYRVRGKICDVFILLRLSDAMRLCATAFRELDRSEQVPLSEVERATLDRILKALASLCVPLCGNIGQIAPERAAHAAIECASYFEVRILEQFSESHERPSVAPHVPLYTSDRRLNAPDFRKTALGEDGIAIGFALTSDPPQEVIQRLRLEDLYDVGVEARVTCAQGEVLFSSFMELEKNTVVPLRTALEERGLLRFGEIVFARGICGVRNGRTAFVIGEN
jgi:Type III flagellar switch regulator (C-ring) FliN C-term